MGECPACGAQVAENAIVCDSCGVDLSAAPLAHERATSVPSQNEPKPPAASEEVAVLGKVEPHPDLAPTAKLICLRAGADAGKCFEFCGAAVIGRFDPSTGPVDVDLGQLSEAATISRVHARLNPVGAATWILKDMDSSNGTFVKLSGDEQFQRISGEYTLQPGTEVAFGNIRFRFET